MKIKLILSITIISLASFSLSSAMSESPDQMLLRALKAGDIGFKNAVKALELGANANTTYEDDNNTALMILIKRSIVHKIEKTVQLLLNAGANINLQNANCDTALDIAKKDIKTHEKKTNLKDVIDILETWPEILKRGKEKVKEEVDLYLLPDLTNIVSEYYLPIQVEVIQKEKAEIHQ